MIGFANPPRVQGLGASVLVLVLLSYPYVYLPAAARFSALPPQLEESARALGRSPFSVFRTIVLPQSWGAIAGGTLLVFLYAVSDFGAVSLMRYDTLTLRIEATRLFDRDVSLTLSFLLAVVALTVVVAERATVRRRAGIEAVGAGRRPLQFALGWTRVPALLFVIALSGFALIAPIAVLMQWTSRGLGGSTTAGGPGVSLSELWTPLVNTASISVIAAIVTVVAVLPIAYLTVRYRSRIGGTVNAVVVGGFALPGLVIALGDRVLGAAGPGLRSALPDLSAPGLCVRGALRRAGLTRRRKSRWPGCRAESTTRRVRSALACPDAWPRSICP